MNSITPGGASAGGFSFASAVPVRVRSLDADSRRPIRLQPCKAR